MICYDSIFSNFFSIVKSVALPSIGTCNLVCRKGEYIRSTYNLKKFGPEPFPFLPENKTKSFNNSVGKCKLEALS